MPHDKPKAQVRRRPGALTGSYINSSERSTLGEHAHALAPRRSAAVTLLSFSVASVCDGGRESVLRLNKKYAEVGRTHGLRGRVPSQTMQRR